MPVRPSPSTPKCPIESSSRCCSPTVSVPLRALFPPDGADDYEALHADPSALRALLWGPAEPMFDALASVALMTHRAGVSGGPVLCNHAWPHAALASILPAREAAQALIVAAQTLLAQPDAHEKRPVAWPVTRPPHPWPRPPTVSMHTLAVGLLDAAVIHVGRAAPAGLAEWLGADVVARAAWILRGMQAQNGLRGYDPLADPSATSAFLFNALRGDPTRLDVGDPPRHGSPLPGVAHRVVLGS